MAPAELTPLPSLWNDLLYAFDIKGREGCLICSATQEFAVRDDAPAELTLALLELTPRPLFHLISCTHLMHQEERVPDFQCNAGL